MLHNIILLLYNKYTVCSSRGTHGGVKDNIIINYNDTTMAIILLKCTILYEFDLVAGVIENTIMKKKKTKTILQ